MATVALAQPSVLSNNVLVLNKFFTAVRIVNLRRAILLLFKEVAEVVSIDEEDKYSCYDFSSWAEISQYKRRFEPTRHDWLRTVSFDLAVPRIIRLNSYDKLGGGHVRFTRRNIFSRDANRCQYCGRKYRTSDLSIDHVLPRSRGGRSTWENVVCCCLRCNVRKGGRTPAEAKLQLIKQPIKPRFSPAITIAVGKRKYQSWKQFLDAAYWNVELLE